MKIKIKIYSLRILILLPVFIIFLVSALRHCFNLTWNFIKYGGEFIEYSNNITPNTIKEVYEELVSQREESKTELNENVVIFNNMKKLSEQLYKVMKMMD